jgi:hypothetical protein
MMTSSPLSDGSSIIRLPVHAVVIYAALSVAAIRFPAKDALHPEGRYRSQG